MALQPAASVVLTDAPWCRLLHHALIAHALICGVTLIQAAAVHGAGWSNGDGDPTNGCETPLNTPQHCGSCAPCNLLHATADCVGSVCVIASCDAGEWWG